jgi:fimbrial chaperone protein
MLLRRLLGGAAAAAPLFFFAHGASAASFDVSPVRIDLSAKTRAAELRLTNMSNEEVSVQVDVRKWSQDFDGTEQLLDTNAVLAVPPLVTIPPGEPQIVRIGRLGEVSLDMEQSYRVLVTELTPAADPSPDQATLRMRLQLSIPVFIAPVSGTAAPEIGVEELDDIGEGQNLILHNVGNGHAKIAEIDVRIGGDWIPLSTDTVNRVRYLLPDARAAVTVPPELGPLSAVRIKSLDGKEWEHAVAPAQ